MFLAAVGCALWRASHVSALSTTETFLPGNSSVEFARRRAENDFNVGEAGNVIEMRLMWGIAGIHGRDKAKWDSSEFGSIILDSSFDLAPEANQQRLLELCTALRARTDLLLTPEGLECFMEAFKGTHTVV